MPIRSSLNATISTEIDEEEAKQSLSGQREWDVSNGEDRTVHGESIDIGERTVAVELPL